MERMLGNQYSYPSQETWLRIGGDLSLSLTFISSASVRPRQKAMLLLNLAGHEAMEHERAFVYAPGIEAQAGVEVVAAESRFDVVVLKRKFREVCEPRRNVIMERHIFNSRKQATSESFENFLSDLKIKATTCEFGALHDDLVRDRIVSGIHSAYVRKQLLKEPNLTMDRAVQICQIHEQTDKQSVEFGDKQAAAGSILSLNQKGGANANKGSQSSQSADKRRWREESRSSKEGNTVSAVQPRDRQTGGRRCYRCQSPKHLANVCPHKSEECRECGRVGHLAKACRTKKQQKVNTMEETDFDYNINTVESSNQHASSFKETVSIHGAQLTMHVDTGASVSLVNEETFKKLEIQWKDVGYEPVLQPSTIMLRTYAGDQLPMLGVCTVPVSYKFKTVKLPLYVVKGNSGMSLLGRNWTKHFSLGCFTVEEDRTDFDFTPYEELFKSELGTIQGVQGHIYMKQDATPKFFKPRPLPYAMKAGVDKELNRLLKEGIVEKIEQSEWAAPIVPVLKPNGDIRICGDYSVTVNQECLVDKYPIPAIEDLYAKLSGGKTFTKLDLSNAYLQVALDKESQLLTTINTHRGLFKYKRLPFGIASSPGIFQRTMDTLLEGIPGVCTYIDDILVTGKDEASARLTLGKVLDRLLKAGIRIKRDKCVFFAEVIEYLGHKIDRNGLRPLPDKIRAVTDAPRPVNVDQLRSYLGLLNHYAKFIKNLSTVLAPLYSLLKKNKVFEWGPSQESAFVKSKSLLTSETLLVHYDSSKSLVLCCDASPYGLGAVLSHVMPDGVERPIAYASRSLAPAELRYSQLEKEGLTCVWGVKKFHKYQFGRTFCLVTDHKPLETLLGGLKPVSPTANARIQRWALSLSAYHYTLIHRKGTSMEADALSRLPLPEVPVKTSEPTETVFLLESVNELLSVQVLQQLTERDPTLSRVRNYVLYGWPASVNDPALQPYFMKRLELSVLNGCVLWGARLVIPTRAQAQVLQLLHDGHSGMVKMKSVARSHVWWPNINAELEEVVNGCLRCLEQRALPALAPLHPWSYPDKPWSRSHVDHAELEGKLILITVDASTKWIDATVVPSTSSAATIDRLRELFATFGLPSTVVSDNATGFTSNEFQQFMKRNGIIHITASPYHPASNGLAERSVRAVKEALRKMLPSDGLKLRLVRFLFRYRNTP
jgi:hypothetical protein